MFPILQLGPLAIQTPGLLLLASIWIGLSLAEKRSAASGIAPEILDNLVLTSLAGFIIGGRLFFVAANMSVFFASPLDIISPNIALFDLTGGLASGLLTGLIFGRRKGLPLWPTLDALTPFFATLMVGVGAAHLAGGSAYGKETDLPWGVFWSGATRHPSQVYEIASALFILNLFGLRRPFKTGGIQFLLFASSTAGAALFLEAFRGDSVFIAGGLRLTQVAAWLILALALVGLELQKGAASENG